MNDQKHRFPCDTCGADLRFSPDRGELVCDHCGNEVDIDTDTDQQNAIAELDFRTAIESGLKATETEEYRVLSCPNCGAQVEFDEKDHAAQCPFCATPVVTGTGVHRHIKPQGLIPFALGEKQGRAAMTKWLGGLWFAPNGLQEYARKGRKLEGMYVPYWTFDADTQSDYRGERGTEYYETRTAKKDGKQVQQRVKKVRWRPKSGHVARWFDDVLVLGTKSLPRDFTDALEPWELANLEPYRPEFLAGFRAEGYTVEIAEAFKIAGVKMDQVIRRDVRFDIGGDRQRIHDVKTTVSGVTFKHILLPVWLAAYKYRGRSYRFVVNGQNGRVHGQRPWSIWKITFAVLVGAAIAASVGFLIATQQQP